MMNGMMSGPMMWGMGLFSILVIIVLVLAAATQAGFPSQLMAAP
jgi:hypothetical protein